MRASLFHGFLLPLLALFSLGASCNATSGERKSGGGAAKPSATIKIERLARVDTKGLTDSERRSWLVLTNELLSPCGEPISVAQCVAEARGCRTCVPAGRYLVRLVAEGLEPSEIRDHFAARYDAKKKVSIDTRQAPVRGAPTAGVTIVEFSDFQCPYCGAAHPVLRTVLEEFAGKVKLVFKHYPLEAHENALPAARAAVAAQAQGKFWEMADHLFEHQEELSPEGLRELAKKVGLDLARYDVDVASQVTQARVDADRKDGDTAEVQGTPALFINGRRYGEGIQSLSKYMREELGT